MQEAKKRLHELRVPANFITGFCRHVYIEYMASVIRADPSLYMDFVKQFINILDAKGKLDSSLVEYKERKFAQRVIHQSELEREKNSNGSRKRVRWTEEEDEVLMTLHNQGRKWKDIAPELVKFGNGRSNVDCKDRMRALKKKAATQGQ